MDSEGCRPDRQTAPAQVLAVTGFQRSRYCPQCMGITKPKSCIASQFALKLPWKIFAPQICTSLWFLSKMSFQVRIYGSLASKRREGNAGGGRSSTTNLTGTSHLFVGVVPYSTLPVPFCQPKHPWGTQWTGKKNRYEQKVKVWAEKGRGRKSEYTYFLIDKDFENKRKPSLSTGLD